MNQINKEYTRNFQQKIAKFFLTSVLWFFLILTPGDTAASQEVGTPPKEPAAHLQAGINLYGQGNWKGAVAELRQSQAAATGTGQWAEALYWISLAEIADADYAAALRDLDQLEQVVYGSSRYPDIPYHRGRAHYYLGRYEDALILFSTFMEGLEYDIPTNEARKSSALYWIGECLYSLGQLDKAQDMFHLIIEQYPQSAKYEASSYRLALINQKKIENELLAIIKWSHEESLKTVEEYQRRERSYDQAIIAYQKRIADLLTDTRYADLEAANTEYRRRLAEAEDRILFLEAYLGRPTLESLPFTYPELSR
jgi:TolA-binding protein